MTKTRSLTMLNASGDSTLEWDEDKDDEMLKVIEARMAAGWIFYVVAKRKPGQRGRVAAPKKLKNAADALKHRSLTIKDADLAKMVTDGHARLVPSSSEPVETVARARTPRQVASGNSVGVRPRAGG